MKLKTLMGDHPVTQAFKSNTSLFDFADVKAPATAFKRVVRNLEFDVAELAIVTFLLAKAHGKPLKLLPAVVMARFQHPFLVYSAERGAVSPKDLKRVGLRSYSVTTSAWIRGILADDFGVDLDRIKWVTFEEPHVAEFRDPPNVERAPEGKEILAMLQAGELDAAIVGAIPNDARFKPVIADPAAAAKAWQKKHGAIQINHMVVVKNTVKEVEEIYRLLLESRKAAGNPEMNPFGIEENRRNLEVAIDCVYRQRMIPRRFTVEELFQ
ncbi:MAG TPA: phosphate ABC transporter substrate-binding protein [Burkholderiales bacterium]|nr:phosphate ABC transporter substrate-binding protein [Burkholderiales bacterium]